MQTHDLIQGSKEWHDFRALHYPASDAPAMMGESKYTSRDELLKQTKTGIKPEVSAATQKLFDDGHATEASARPTAEKVIDDDLYPVTGSLEVEGLPLSASFDGITMCENTLFEHKRINDVLRGISKAKDLPEMYKIQMDQQLLISGAEKCLFMASDGTDTDMVHFYYKTTKARTKKLLAGWKQFAIDLEAFEVKPEVVVPIGKALEPLPVLSVIATGEIKSSNLPAYKSAVSTYISNINETLETDEQFADAEQAVKGLKKGEGEASDMVTAILSQTATIKEVIDTVEYLASEMRTKRLTLEKLVKAEKANRKAEIIGSAEQELSAHIEALNNSTAPYVVGGHDADFNEAVKGKKTILSMQNAVNTEIARIKISLNEHAELIIENAAYLNETASEYMYLFRDAATLVNSEAEYFRLMVNDRITSQKAKEEEKRAAIQAEEERKAIAKVEAEQKVKELPMLNDQPDTEPQVIVSTEPTPPASFDPPTGSTRPNPANGSNDKTITVYASCDKDGMCKIGESIGLSGEPLRMFANFNEVKLRLVVNMNTGVVVHHAIDRDKEAA